MITKNGVIDAVNEGIESGEIEVGGGLPEIEEGDAGKVLKVNEAEDGAEWGEAGGGTTTFLPNSFVGINNKIPNIDKISVSSSNQIAGSHKMHALVLQQPLYALNFDYTATLNFGDENYGGSSLLINPIPDSMNNITVKVPHGFGLAVGPFATNGYANDLNLQGGIILGGRSDSTIAQYYSSQGINVNSSIINIHHYTVKADYAAGDLYNSLMLGESHELAYRTACCIGVGNGLTFTTANNQQVKEKAIFGKFNSPTDLPNGDVLQVGVGTSTSARANCFTTGTNATDGDYIKIGDTKLTETQLQALLATLS